VISQEQILALAPDASSIKAGEGLAAARKWVSVGRDARAVWGLLQGSGKQPYQARVSLSDLTSACSCPSRKFPCKHGLGLMFLLARSPDAVPEAPAPEFVEEWLGKRAEKAAKKAEAATAPPRAPVDEARSAEAAQKRDASRERRTLEGLADLDTWLRDLAAEGLAAQDLRRPETWELRARRLNDAQLPGLARQLTELGRIAVTRADWLDPVVFGLGRIHLSLRAHERRESMDEAERQDLFRFFGAAQREAEIAPESHLKDTWYCLGAHGEQQERMTLRRSWLLGRRSGRLAALLQFAVANQPMPAAPVLNADHELTLGFFPGRAPLRAAIVAGNVAAAQPGAPPANAGRVSEALASVADRLALDPWTAQFPVLLRARLARGEDGTWWLADEVGDALPAVSRESMYAWLARSLGESADWFGEWDGETLRLLGAWPRC
jgi:hypothetical protein